MSFRELAVLLPCHSLEDFPQHYVGEEADGLLANWTALWHPDLLAPLSRGPAWYRADNPPESLEGRLILVPAVSQPELPVEFAQHAAAAGACVIENHHDRAEIVARALAAVGVTSRLDQALVNDFLALGYGYLQIQLLTRQMRYSSNLDDEHFFGQLLQAARAAVDGDAEAAESRLTACFDLLAEERDHYYSVDAYLLDLTILSRGANVEELSAGAAEPPVNVLISGETLAHIAESQPATLEWLQAQNSGIGLVGGEYRESTLPLLSCETLLGELRGGREVYQSLLHRSVEVYGRRRCGLSPMLPQVLEKLGYCGALHFTLDDGRFPQATQTKTRWEGCDGSAVDAIAKVPLDANCPGTFLGFAHRLGESMDMDHIATLCLAHWQGQYSVWYDDLRRCARRGAALGRFVTVDEYFRDTYVPGHLDRFDPDRYHTPYLRQGISKHEKNLLSRHVDYWRSQATAESRLALAMLRACVVGRVPQTPAPASDGGAAAHAPAVSAELVSAARQLADELPRQDGPAEAGYLAVNPTNFARRVLLDVSGLARLPDAAKPVYAAAEDGDRKWAVVDLPAMGFSWVTAGRAPASQARSAPCLAEQGPRRDGMLLLRNEYFEAVINPQTGALHSLRDYDSRDNRLSQQLALRRGRGQYSTMVAEHAAVTQSNQVCGAVVTRGKLIDSNRQTVCEFEQTFRVERGSRVLRVEVELTPNAAVSADPWESYYACRFAWADETAQLYRSLHQTRQATESKRIEAPLFVEIDTGTTRTALLMGGLPYHRRVDARVLDTLLIVAGEDRRCFQLGIAVDVANPLDCAQQLLLPPLSVQQSRPPPTPSQTGWLFHIDSKQLAVTHWKALLDEDDRVVGVRIRLLETLGRPARARASCFRPLRSARRADFRGESLGDCRIVEGRVHLELTAFEWSEFEWRWDDQR